MFWNLLKKMLNPASQVAKLITPLFIQIGYSGPVFILTLLYERQK